MRFWRNAEGCCCGEAGCGTIAVTVRVCGEFANYEGATVAVKDADGATVGSGVTGPDGLVTVAIAEAGTYTVVVDAAGRPRSTTTLAATCTANQVLVEFDRSYLVAVRGCNGRAMPGATVALTRDGVTYSGATDAAGSVEVPLPADGTYAVAVTAPLPGFAALEYAVEIAGCGIWGDETLTLEPDANHKCVSWGDRFTPPFLQDGQCLYPWPTTLHATDALYGAITLTWFAVEPVSGSTDVWYGSKTATVPACGDCPEVTTELRYFLSRQVGAGGGVYPLVVRANVNVIDGCPGGPYNEGSVSRAPFEDDAQVACPPSPAASFTIEGGARSPYCADTAVTITA